MRLLPTLVLLLALVLTSCGSDQAASPADRPVTTPYEKAIAVCGGDKGISSFEITSKRTWKVDCLD